MLTAATAVRFEIVARTSPELVERLCRVVRHRGASLVRLVAQTGDEGTSTVELTVRVGGDGSLLERQIARVADVRSITRQVLVSR